MKKKLLLLSLSSLMSIPLISCSNEEEDGWGIKKLDYQNIIQFENQVTRSNGKIKFKIDNEYGPFKNELKSEDIIVFDVSKIKDEDQNSYYSYKEYKACEINKEEFTALEEGRGFEVTFDGDIDSLYGVIINKEAMLQGDFAISSMDKSIRVASRLNSDEGEWIDAYIESRPEEHTDYSMQFIEIGVYVAALVFSCMTGNVVSACTSVYGILSLLDNTFKPEEPGIQDVLNRLDEIDAKLDEINEEIKRNQAELVNEQIYTEALIDRLAAEEYQRDITAYVTDYVNPVESIERKYSQYTGTCYKNLVKAEPGYVELHFTRNEKNKLVQLSQSEVGYDSAALVIRVPMDSYGNAKKFVIDHNDVVVEGFTKELDKDIDATIANHLGKELPTGEINAEQYRQYINSAILDEFEKNKHSGEQGSEAFNDASDMLDKAINFCKRISGVSTGQSILASFIGRIKYMYNFAAEAKQDIINIIANIKSQTEKISSMAETACRYAKINSQELTNEFNKAIDVIQAYYDSIKKMADTHSFITNTTINSQFMYAKYTADFRNEGENPEFKKEFVTEQVDSFNWNMNIIHKTPIKLAEKVLVTRLDAARIYKRYQILLNSGFTDKTDYLDYLVSAGGIHKNNYETQQALLRAKWIGEDTYRILTDYEGITNVSKSDNITFTCTKRGNSEGGDYFTVGGKYKYQCDHGDEYWRGEKASGRFIDAHSGTELANHLISAYARYSKAKWWMIDNEHWAFSSNPAGAYFYIMYQV